MGKTIQSLEKSLEFWLMILVERHDRIGGSGDKIRFVFQKGNLNNNIKTRMQGIQKVDLVQVKDYY